MADMTSQPNQTTRMATMQDIADRCNISITTVSRALRHDSRIAAATMERVLATAKEIGYDAGYHHAARRMALRRLGRDALNYTLMVTFPVWFHQYTYYHHILHGMMEESAAVGFRLLLTYVPETVSAKQAGTTLVPADVDGIIAINYQDVLPPLLDALRMVPTSENFSLVTLLSPSQDNSAVLIDDRRGAYASTAHLLDLGHRHILHFWQCDPSHYSYYERAEGCRQAYRERGLDPGEYVTAISVKDPHEHDVVVAQMLQALHQHPEITGVLALFDYLGMLIRDALEQQGLRVPRDISVVGFDDVDPTWDKFGRNILTTVRVPLIELGREAVRLLIRQVTGQGAHGARVILPVELVIRKTTAPPAPKRRRL